MEIKEIDIRKIRPDPHQPRKSFDEEDIDGMAHSIKTSGIINAIEVDPSYVIITGEQRWRAAKKAGMKKVPVKVMKIKKEARFMRQVIENVHHHSMTEWEEAEAFKKLLAAQLDGGLKYVGGNPNQGLSLLSRELGVSRNTIERRLLLLKMSKPFQTAMKKGRAVGDHSLAIKATPAEYQKKIEKKILAGEFKNSGGSLELAAALKRNPTVGKKLLAINYSKYPTTQAVQKVVEKISPSKLSMLEGALKPSDELGALTKQYLKWLDINTPESVGKFNLHRCVVNLQTVEKEIIKWLKK